MKLSLVGLPASGKGTLGNKLSEHYGIPIVYVGQLLRSVQPHDHKYSKIHEFMDKGLMVPPEIVGQMIKDHIESHDLSKGFILDGWLRQLVDLEIYDPEIDFMLHLKISEKTAQRRIDNRLICQQEGHTYNLLVNPPSNKGICDIDGSVLIPRKDDDPSILENRLKIFREKTTKVLDHYHNLGLLLEIDAEPLPNLVFENAVMAVDSASGKFAQ